MSLRPRRAGTRTLRAASFPVALLFALLLSLAPGLAFAQDATPEVTPAAETTEAAPAAESTPEATPVTDPVTPPSSNRVVGSGIAAPLFNALSADATIPATVEVTGTNTGISEFCAGLAAAVVTTRPLTPAEEETCTLNGVSFQEVLIAHSAAALIVNAEADFVGCLTPFDLAPIFAPSATTANWNAFISTYPDLPLTVALPPTNTAAYTLLDSLVEGDGLRVDTTPLESEDAVIAAVAADQGTIGVVSLEAAAGAGNSVRTVEFNFGEAGCAAPGVTAIEGRTYEASQPILVYRNLAGSDDVLTMLETAVSDAAAATVSREGFTSPTAETLALMREGLANGTAGRLYSRTQTNFEISPNVSGAIEIAGATANSDYVNNITTAFTGSYPGVTANVNLEGAVAGVRRFCNGEVDLIATTAPLTAEQTDNCAANNITPYPVSLGSQAVVLVRNTADEFAQCLTTAQLATIFGSASNAAVTNWNQVDPAYPDLPLFTFESALGSPESGILLLAATGTQDPGRVDAQINVDPLYRAAATGGTPGVISLYTWSDYQQVVASGQENVTPIAIDAGNGCVEPTEATIADQSYPLARPLTLLVNRASFAKPQVQSLVWFILSDENYVSLTASGLVGLAFGDLPELRADLQETFTQVAIEVANAAESTPEPAADAEATPEATAEAGS